jgi:hypothetical protein
MGKSRAIPSSTSYSSSLQRKWPSSSSSELESEKKAEIGRRWGVFARFSSSESSCWSWVWVGEAVGGAAGLRGDDMLIPCVGVVRGGWGLDPCVGIRWDDTSR